MLTRYRQDMGHAAKLKRLVEFLGYERAVPQNHPPHDGRLPGMEPVPERRVGAAVHAADPAPVLVHGPHAGGLHDRGDTLGRQVSRVIEAVLTYLGTRDLAVHPHPVSHPDAQVAREHLYAPTTQDLPAPMPEMLDPDISPVAPATRHRRRRDLSHYDNLPGLQRGQLGERVWRTCVQNSWVGGERRVRRGAREG